MLIGLMMAGAGCLSLEQAAPQATALVAAGSPVPGELVRGRELYITACAKCHAVEPVLDYPREQWLATILPEMNKLTKLTPGDAAAVQAYVLAVHAGAATRN
jgi:mono/diheme cytochrome c family protein